MLHEDEHGAVNWCIHNDCMVEYLRKHREEVTDGDRAFGNDKYAEINDIYSAYFNSRFENADANVGTPSDSAVSHHRVSGVSVYNYMWGPSEFSCTGTLRGHDSTKLLSKIKVPILYICGQYDSGTFEAAQKYFEKTNIGEITVLPGCAHNASRERPVEFNAAIRAFIERISK